MRSLSDPAQWIEHAAEHCPQRLFLREPAPAGTCSYAELRVRSGYFVSALIRRGVGPGDRVAVQVEKSADAVLLYIACLRMGAVYVPINTLSTPPEVGYYLQDSQPRIAIIRPADRLVVAPLAHAAGVPQLETLGAEGEGTLAELVGERVEYDPQQDLRRLSDPLSSQQALAAIVYTSGTTGRSKGAVLTRGNLASNAATLAREWRFTETDILLHALPLFHVHGLFVAINTVLASASGMVLLPKFAARAALEHLGTVTVFMGVPTFYTRLLQEPALDHEATRHVRLFVSGSAPLLPETQREFAERTGHWILERYGMTETLMNTSNPYEGPRIPGSVGPPLPQVAVRVVDCDDGRVLHGPDQIGCLEIAGPNVFAGYWRDEEKTRAAFSADGWFKTGDLGRIDHDGYVYIVGRAKDLVISGGYNIYPREVEAELDAVAGVLESAVFGVPHPDFGEGVTAAVVAKPGAFCSESVILAALRARLAGYKIPKRIIMVAALPRNAMGKIQKNVLRTTYAALYRSPGLNSSQSRFPPAGHSDL